MGLGLLECWSLSDGVRFIWFNECRFLLGVCCDRKWKAVIKRGVIAPSRLVRMRHDALCYFFSFVKVYRFFFI